MEALRISALVRNKLARFVHDGSSSPTLPSPIAWVRVRARDKRELRFEVPNISNFGSRTVVRLTSRAFPASLA